jgi:D-sedoheptulose 7-phosphate isomerase
MLKPPSATTALGARIAQALRARTPLARPFFATSAESIARTAGDVARRLHAGGCIYTFGRGPYATDAQHTAVEFVHPVLVGKRALPATDLSLSFETSLPALVRQCDVVIGYGPPHGDTRVAQALAAAQRRGAYTIALPGSGADFALDAPTDDEHVHQEIVEIVGHLLYECVQVFLEHRTLDRDAGASTFLYPFLGGTQQPPEALVPEISASVLAKAADAQALRERVAEEESPNIAQAVRTIARECASGGRLLLFGNGGSATDATDWALDCVYARAGTAPIPAISLAAEPATITAIANDIGREFIFARQLIAHLRPHDVAVALSTSGGSLNVIAGLEEARKRGNATIALLGYDGGEIARRALADHAMIVRSDYIPRVQEAQAAIYHTMRRAVDWVRDGA